MNTKDLIYKMVAELSHNSRKYNDGCGGINYDLLASEMGSRLRLMDRNAFEAPEWVFNAAIEASTIFKNNRTQQRKNSNYRV